MGIGSMCRKHMFGYRESFLRFIGQIVFCNHQRYRTQNCCEQRCSLKRWEILRTIGEEQMSWETLWTLRIKKLLDDTRISNGRTRSISPSPLTFLPRSFPAALSSAPLLPPWTHPSSVATCGRRPTVAELTQLDCFLPQGPTQTDWCLIILCVPIEPFLEKDRLDVHLHLPGGGRLQRPHRGGCRPGRPPLHRCQRHRLRGLDGSHVGCMVGWATFDFIFFYIFLGMVT